MARALFGTGGVACSVPEVWRMITLVCREIGRLLPCIWYNCGPKDLEMVALRSLCAVTNIPCGASDGPKKTTKTHDSEHWRASLQQSENKNHTKANCKPLPTLAPINAAHNRAIGRAAVLSAARVRHILSSGGRQKK